MPVLLTMPAQKIVFIPPFDNKATYYTRIINPGRTGISFAFEERTKPQRITVSPPYWRMGPMDSVYVAISCDAFDPSAENTRDDSLTLKWCRLPESGRAAFFMIGRKEIPIEYNV